MTTNHHPKLDRETAWDFQCYIEIADSEGIPVGRLDPQYRAAAKRAADRLTLPWPPEFRPARDFVLSHGAQLRHLLDTTPGTT